MMISQLFVPELRIIVCRQSFLSGRCSSSFACNHQGMHRESMSYIFFIYFLCSAEHDCRLTATPGWCQSAQRCAASHMVAVERLSHRIRTVPRVFYSIAEDSYTRQPNNNVDLQWWLSIFKRCTYSSREHLPKWIKHGFGGWKNRATAIWTKRRRRVKESQKISQRQAMGQPVHRPLVHPRMERRHHEGLGLVLVCWGSLPKVRLFSNLVADFGD